MTYRFSRWLALILSKLLFRIEFQGREFIPEKGGFILVSNHLSYLDPIAVGTACPREVSFMAKDTLFDYPLLARWLKAVGVIPVKRGAPDPSAIKTAIRNAASGKGLALFPEGSRREKENAFINPEPGAGFLADKLNVPVIPAFVSGTEKALPKGAKFLRPVKVRVRFGQEIHIERGKPYREISEAIMAKIKNLANK
ncbi:MAG: lysophospholipid acyltransferase family protein [Candidatus Omnitrophica bacterium]|nr:lysophospholipid acyltransferase family protein [Candidatus Omnitrophota bacterium]